MNCNRRTFIQQALAVSLQTGMVGGIFLQTQNAQATWIAEDFTPGPLSATLKHLYNDAIITESEAITLKLPRIAENGAVVPITVSTTLAKVSDIAIFVTKNPTPLSGKFKLSPDLEPVVSARIKMAETSDVLAIVTSEGKLYKAFQEVKVTIGGCGG